MNSGNRTLKERMGLGADAGSNGNGSGQTAKRERHPTMTLRLGNEDGSQRGMLYGTLLSGPQYHPSHGIRIVFEEAYAEGWGQWVWSCWEVTITGTNLLAVYWGLCDSKQSGIKEGANEPEEGEGDRPEVSRIEVRPVKVAGYPPK